MRIRSTLPVCLLALLCMVRSSPPLLAGDNLSNERGTMRDVLNVVSKEVEKNFYDPKMNGLNWQALTDQARERIDKAQSVGDMMRAVFILVEKLGDSHTRFLPPNRNVTYSFGFNAKPIGDEIRVYDVKEMGVADAAGIKVGDRILAVNGFRTDRSLYDIMMWDFKVIRNAPALELQVQTDNDAPRIIRLEARRKVEPVILDFTQNREDIWNLIRESDKQEQWKYQSFQDGIGYAQIRAFQYEQENFFIDLIEKSNAKKAVIIDLRNNPGGSEDTLKAFAGNFEREQVVMGDIKSRKKDEQMVIKPRRPYYDMPMVILVDSETGSAAEMFAKHFQLRKKAIVIGDRSSGRVTRSMFFSERLGTDRVTPFGVQIGMSRFVFPDGTELEKNGVVPDIQCLPSGRDMREQKDVCLWKAVEVARANLGLPSDQNLREGVKSGVDH